jgi:hypothetical protein
MATTGKGHRQRAKDDGAGNAPRRPEPLAPPTAPAVKNADQNPDVAKEMVKPPRRKRRKA